MNALDNLWLSQYQKVIIAFEVRSPIYKAFTTIIFFFELVTLNHGTHRTIDNKDALGKKCF